MDSLRKRMQDEFDSLTQQLSTAIADMPSPRTPTRVTTNGTQTATTYTSITYTQTVEPESSASAAQTVSTCADKNSWISAFGNQDGKTCGGGDRGDGGNPYGEYFVGDEDDVWEEGLEEEQADPDEVGTASSVADSSLDVGWPRTQGGPGKDDPYQHQCSLHQRYVRSQRKVAVVTTANLLAAAATKAERNHRGKQNQE